MTDIEKFGLNIEEVTKMHDTLEELKNSQCGIVIANCCDDFDISINQSKYGKIFKNEKYVMPLGIYENSKFLKMNDGTQKTVYEAYEEPFSKYFKRYNGEDLTNKTLLIWRTGGIGDIIFIQPCLKFLKKKYPTCKIWFSCSPSCAPILNGWDCIDKYFPLPFSLNYLKESDYHCTFEGVIERCKEAETTNVYKLFAKWLNLDIPEEDLVPVLYTRKCDDIYVKKILKELNIECDNYIYVQPKASVLLRSPAIKHWMQILAELIFNKQTIVFNTMSTEHELLKRAIEKYIRPEFEPYIKYFSKYSTDIGKAMSLVKFSKLVIAPDSSTMHIAAGLGKKSYGIYGPFPGSIRLSTYKKCKWIEPEPLNICNYMGRHCCLHVEQVCPKHEQYISPCFDLIDYQKVRNELNSILKIKGVAR